MERVAMVTDSTASLPRDLLERHGITVVSLYCNYANGESIREQDVSDLTTFYEELDSGRVLPATSPPAVEDFIAAYRPLLDDGTSVVSIHISSGLSETCANARQAIEQMTAAGAEGDRIHVIDSASTAGELGIIVLAGALAAEAGRDGKQVANIARDARLESRSYFLLDTLEYLKRGGRIGSAAAWIGSTLNVKPILTLESEIRAVERVRSRKRGVDRLLDFARQLRAAGCDRWGVQHTCAEEEAQEFSAQLQKTFWHPPEFISELGPVLAIHSGPGSIGFGAIPSRFLG